MNQYKNIARMMGILYILGTVSGVLSRIVTGPMLTAPDLLASISENVSAITMGALFVMVMGLALSMIPVLAYPLLKKFDEVLALGYVVFRGALEGVYYVLIVISWLLLLPLARVYQAGSLEAINFQSLANVLLQTKEIAFIGMLVFGLGGLLFYSLLFRARLVPRWLSGWGLIALVMNLAVGLLVLFDVLSPISTISDLLQFPIFLQEMVLAVWFIAKGFNPTAVAARPAGEAIN